MLYDTRTNYCVVNQRGKKLGSQAGNSLTCTCTRYCTCTHIFFAESTTGVDETQVSVRLVLVDVFLQRKHSVHTKLGRSLSLERSSRSSAHERPSASDLDKGCTGRLSARTHSMSTPPMEKSGVDASNHVVLEQVVAKTSRCQSKSAPKSSRKPKNKGGRPTHTQAQHEAAYVAKKQRQRDKRTAASQQRIIVTLLR